jgi:hypothetical protein
MRDDVSTYKENMCDKLNTLRVELERLQRGDDPEAIFKIQCEIAWTSKLIQELE